jgi:hypothetical protein
MKALKDRHTRELLRMLNDARPSGFYWVDYPSGPKYSVEDIKAELATREHIPNKAEAKKIRQQKAKEKRNR